MLRIAGTEQAQGLGIHTQHPDARRTFGHLLGVSGQVRSQVLHTLAAQAVEEALELAEVLQPHGDRCQIEDALEICGRGGGCQVAYFRGADAGSVLGEWCAGSLAEPGEAGVAGVAGAGPPCPPHGLTWLRGRVALERPRPVLAAPAASGPC